METHSDDEKKAIREPLVTKAPTSISKGGVRTLPFIIANESFEKVASLGLTPNMILYLTREYGMESTEAANVLFMWSAATSFTPIFGAFLADAYVGKYQMIGFGSILSFLGMVLLWLTAMFPQARPKCDQFSGFCESPTTPQLLLLYSSFGLMAIGAGGIRSSSIAFGSDQVDKRNNPENEEILQSYFSWYYATSALSSLIAVTVIVYIQENLGWKIGFGVPVVLIFVAALSFYLASPFYIKLKASTSLFTSLAQVVVASFRNRHINLPSQASNQVCYYFRLGSKLHVPSEKLRFLNKACVIKNPQEDLTSDGNASNPWSLCTIDQVEELKALFRVMPLWSTGIMFSVAMSQGSFTILQANSMDRHITPSFEIPVGSFMMFMMGSLVLWVALYDRILLPLGKKIKGKPVRLDEKQRMGIGIVLSCVSLVSLAIVEYIRRKIAIQGLTDEPKAAVHMSALWLLPHYILDGVAEAFGAVGQIEFCCSELPKAMASIASNLFGLGMSAASLVASFISTTVDDVTKSGGDSWLSSNINKGHYDYYYWLLAALSVLNFLYFLACSKAYGPCQGDDRDERTQGPASRIGDDDRI